MNVSSEPILRFVEEFEDDYKSAIAYLGDYPAKPLINSLTIMAGEVTSTSPLVVVQVIEDEIINVRISKSKDITTRILFSFFLPFFLMIVLATVPGK